MTNQCTSSYLKMNQKDCRPETMTLFIQLRLILLAKHVWFPLANKSCEYRSRPLVIGAKIVCPEIYLGTSSAKKEMRYVSVDMLYVILGRISAVSWPQLSDTLKRSAHGCSDFASVNISPSVWWMIWQKKNHNPGFLSPLIMMFNFLPVLSSCIILVECLLYIQIRKCGSSAGKMNHGGHLLWLLVGIRCSCLDGTFSSAGWCWRVAYFEKGNALHPAERPKTLFFCKIVFCLFIKRWIYGSFCLPLCTSHHKHCLHWLMPV